MRYFISRYLPGHELADHSTEIATRRYCNVIVHSDLFTDDLGRIRCRAVSTGK